jgi:hypothetical protein
MKFLSSERIHDSNPILNENTAVPPPGELRENLRALSVEASDCLNTKVTKAEHKGHEGQRMQDSGSNY